MENIIQTIFLLITGLLFHIGCTNPNAVKKTDYVAHENQFVKIATSIGPLFGKSLVWASTFLQIYFLHFANAIPIDLLSMSPSSLSGFILMIVGGLGRIWCYRTLGQFFTYQLTIQKSHELVASGPYAYLRHPSYTFAYLLTAGMFIVHQRLVTLSQHSFVIIVGSGLPGFLMFSLIFVSLIFQRVAREEEELKKQFGKQWTDYASKRARFIPWILWTKHRL